MSDYGIKVSAEGDDALTAEFNKLITSSKYPTPKTKIGTAHPHFGSGEYKMPASGTAGVTVLEIPHGYGYTPTCLVLVSTGGGSYRIAPTIWYGDGPEIDAYCDATNFTIYVGGQISNVYNEILKYRYYIFDRNGT